MKDKVIDTSLDISWIQLTIWRVSELPAYNTGIIVVPKVITDGSPSAIDTHLNSAKVSVPTISNKLNASMAARS